MHPPDRAVVSEPPVAGGLEDLLVPRRTLRPGDALEDLPSEPRPDVSRAGYDSPTWKTRVPQFRWRLLVWLALGGMYSVAIHTASRLGLSTANE